MLVLRDLVGIEPLGGLYRALAGEGGGARPSSRDGARRRHPRLPEERLPRRGRLLGADRPRDRARPRLRRADPRPATSGTTRSATAAARPGATSRPMCRVKRQVNAPNPEQVAAIEAPGVVFVSAGAGTGKTTVLVERFVKAVCERGLDVDSLLVITYTERAAGELRDRIRARLIEAGRPELARELDAAWISTIHGFCHRLLRSHPFAAGHRPALPRPRRRQARVLAARGVRAGADRVLRRRRRASGSACSRRTASAGCGGCSPASTRRCALRAPARARARRAARPRAGSQELRARPPARSSADDGGRGDRTRDRRTRARAPRASARCRSACSTWAS